MNKIKWKDLKQKMKQDAKKFLLCFESRASHQSAQWDDLWPRCIQYCNYKQIEFWFIVRDAYQLKAEYGTLNYNQSVKLAVAVLTTLLVCRANTSTYHRSCWVKKEREMERSVRFTMTTADTSTIATSATAATFIGRKWY